MKTPATVIFGLVCFALISLTGCDTGDRKVTLRLKYRPGMKLVYEQTTKRTTRITAGDSLIEQSGHFYDANVTFNIISLDEDGVAEVLDSTTWSYEVADSANPGKMKQVNRTRVSTQFIQPDGRCVDLGLSPNENIATVSWLKSYFEQGMPVFPEGELSPGYSWTQTTKVMLPDETLDASTTYTIKSIAREAGYDCAVIEFDGNMIIPVVETEVDNCSREGYDEIKISGVTYFAYKEGIVVIERQGWQVLGHRRKKCDGIVDRYQINSRSDLEFTLTRFEKP